MARPCDDSKHKSCVWKGKICPYLLLVSTHFPMEFRCNYPNYGTYYEGDK